MMKFKMLVVGVVFSCVLMVSVNAFSDQIPIDLNDFFLDGPGSIDSSSSATLQEDTILVNDPMFGDPGLSVPTSAVSLNFTYIFTEHDDDEFYAWLWDDATTDDIEYWYIDASAAGTYSIDLIGLDPSITLMGLEFGINVWGTYGSQEAVISNVYFETADSQSTSPVPEPSTMLLFGTGIAGLVGAARKKHRNKKNSIKTV